MILKPRVPRLARNGAHHLNNGLVNAWLFTEGGGLRAYALDNLVSTGVFTSGPTWAAGRNGPAIAFTGASNQYLDCGPGASLSSFSIASWVYPKSFAAAGVILNKGTGNLRNYDLDMGGGSGKVRLVFTVGSGNFKIATGATAPQLNRWHLVVGTFDGLTERVFLNGIADGTNSITATPDTTTGLRIGTIGTTADSFDGLISEVRLWNRALQPDEIQELYLSDYSEFAPRSSLSTSVSTAASSYDVSQAEAVALSDDASDVASLPSSTAEAITLADAASAAILNESSVSEAVALSDATDAGTGIPRSVDEAVALSDATDATTGMAEAVDEAVALSDATDAVVIFTVAEAVALSDATDATTDYPESQAEAMALADAPSSIGTFGVSRTEALALADGRSSTAILPSTVGEAMTLADAGNRTIVDIESVFEAVALADVASAGVVHGASVFEVMSMLDRPVTGGGAYQASVSEALALSDAPGSGVHAEAVVEAVALSDAPSSRAVLHSTVVEAVGLSDSESNPTPFAVSVDEVMALADYASTPTTRAPGNAAVTIIG